jgi:hypothetical protein
MSQPTRVISRTSASATDTKANKEDDQPVTDCMLTSELIATDAPTCSDQMNTGNVVIGPNSTISVSLHTRNQLRSYYIQTNDLFAAISSCISTCEHTDDKWTYRLIIHNARDTSRNLRIVWG